MSEKNREQFHIIVPGEELIYFDLPKKRAKEQIYNIRWRDGQGKGDGIFANICKLDLKTNVVRSLFHEPRDKVIVFAKDYDTTMQWLLPIATEFDQELRFAIGNPAETIDALGSFGLDLKDCPTAVIHTTQPADVKYLMPKLGNKRPPLTEKSLRSMIEQHLSGRLPPIGGNDADDE